MSSRWAGMLLLLSWLQPAVGVGIALGLSYLFGSTWKLSERAKLMQREAASPYRIEGDDAGGVPRMTSASDEYREECKRTGGTIAAESRAAATMREAATPAVRRAQREDGGYVKKDSPTAKLAASEAKAKRPRTTEKGPPSP